MLRQRPSSMSCRGAAVSLPDTQLTDAATRGGFWTAWLQAKKLEVSLSSSGDLCINGGHVGEQRIHISSSGDYQASGLQSQKCQIGISSSGDASVWATGSLDASLSGSGDLEYRGNPAVRSTVTGSGDIRLL